MIPLARKIDRYRRNECRRSNNRLTPGRCKAATKYANQANKFIKQTMNDSKTETDSSHVNLYNTRKMSKTRDIYPINNHDFDYKTAMIKNHNIYKLGFTNQPTVSYLFKYPKKLRKYLNLLVNDPYPNKNTQPGVDDVLDTDRKRMYIKNKYKVMDNKPPYPSFRKDYPECRFKTKGEHSSSYFVRTGVCKTKINNKAECERKKFNWVENKPIFPKIFKTMMKTSKKAKPVTKLKGSCYKPRYMYIDNSSKDVRGRKGLQPSLFADIMDITPDKLFQILAGNSVDGGGIIPCPEDFVNYNSKVKEENNSENTKICLIMILLLSLIIYILVVRR
tara:strand:- start:3590 stop:4588 length:999 start_codon:yes stop_codon:yes gene_type:complete